MPNYTKLFNSIVTSTIWSEDDKTRIIWITMLALADQNGEVQASIPGLARLAGVQIADVESALVKFTEPDNYSRTPDNQGRRIAMIDGGWELLNHAKYRRMASLADKKESSASRQKRFRDRNAPVTLSNAPSVTSNAPVTLEVAKVTLLSDIAEAEAEAEAEADKSKRRKEQLSPPFSSEQFVEAWDCWVRYKSERRQKLTDSTIKGTFKKMAAWGEGQSIDAIESSISNGWQGLFEPTVNGAKKPKFNGTIENLELPQ